MATSDKKWAHVHPGEYDKYKAPKENDFTSWEDTSGHDTRKRDKPKRRLPCRSKSAPLPRSRDERMKQNFLSDWKTQEFGDEAESGPGMTSGPLQPIGSAKEAGPWEKSAEDRLKEGKDITQIGPFIGITRKPKAAKLPTHNEDLPGYNVPKKACLG